MAIFITPGNPGYQGPTSVGTSATEVFNTGATGLVAGSQNVIIQNDGPVTVYLGQSGVTSSTGLALAPGEQWILQGTMVNVYAITASGTSVVIGALASVLSVV